MDETEKASAGSKGVTYEVRALTDRWVAPTKGDVISSHTSARAAMNAFAREPEGATDGTGRTSHGNFVAKAVVRVDAQGKESMLLPPPVGSGNIAWPYPN
jgi:hypothetical protein